MRGDCTLIVVGCFWEAGGFFSEVRETTMPQLVQAMPHKNLKVQY